MPETQHEEISGPGSPQQLAIGVDESPAGAQGTAARPVEVPVAKILADVLTMNELQWPSRGEKAISCALITKLLALGVYSTQCTCASTWPIVLHAYNNLECFISRISGGRC